jgi:hypothetical protein
VVVGRGTKHPLIFLEVEVEAKVEAKNFAPKMGTWGERS